jgi:hypothetical protein
MMPASARREGFEWQVDWQVDWRVEWLFAIKCRPSRRLARHSADRGDSVLPTSPRPIEVGS